MSAYSENICAYEVLIDGEKYIAVPRQYRNASCVQISLARPWNVNDITSALVAGDGTIIEAARFIVRNDHEMSELIDCAASALTGETRLLFERFRRIGEAVLACDPVCVTVLRSSLGAIDMPALPRTSLPLQPLALRPEIRMTQIFTSQP